MKVFNHVPNSIKIPRPRRITLPNGKRTYTTPDGFVYPSITTVVGIVKEQAIQEWRERVGKEEADRISGLACKNGTEMHGLIETFLKNEQPSSDNSTARILFNRLRPILERIDNIRVQEAALWSDELMVAGTCDCIADYSGVPSVIDFKSSLHAKREDWILDYFLQASAYSWMWEERTGEKVEQIAIIIAASDFSTKVFVKQRADYRVKLEETIIRYYETRYHTDFGIPTAATQ